MCYYYDKTFLGFLSLIFEIFKNKNWDVLILRENENSLFQGEFVETNHENANRVYKKLLKIIGKNNLRLMYCSFLSEETNIELTLLGYIRQALKYGYSLPKHFTPEVVRVEKLSRRVNFEAHRFMGLVRFRKLMDDTYISVINPDNDILPLIMDHFTDRFSNQNFVIYDENRKRAILYDSLSKQAAIKEIFDFDKRLFDMNNFELMHEEEKEYISLWKKFFESIAIEDRKNPRLQKSFMPEKYWKNLVEID
jgi:probable DNA metabolism protein